MAPRTTLEERGRIALVLVVAAAALGACGGSPPASGAPGGARGGKPLAVGTVPVERGVLARRIEGTGSLEAYQVVTVAARVEGVVESVAVDEGDPVDGTRSLAVIDGRRRTLEHAQAKAALAEAAALLPRAQAATSRAVAGVERTQALERVAQAELSESQALLARREKMRVDRPGLVPDEEIELTASQVARRREALGVAEAARREAEAALTQARADEVLASQAGGTAQARLDLAAKVLEDTDVRTPIAGVVRRRHATLGQYVRAGDPLLEIVDRSRLRVRFRVTEAESVLLAKNQPLTFRVPSLGEEEHTGRVVHVDETASPVSRMVECLGEVQNPPPALKPGFFVVAGVDHVAQGVLRVPEEALLPGEQGWTAFVVDGGVARQRVLRLGLRSRDGDVEVLEGLAEGESLIVKGARIVTDGQAVAPAPEPAAGPGATPGGATPPAPPSPR